MGLTRIQLKGLWIIMIGVLIATDQLIKYAVMTALSSNEPWVITPFFNLTFTHNKGIAFSLLDQSPDIMHFLVTVVGVLITSFVIFWFWRMPIHYRLAQSALVCIIAGAIGNLIDRLLLGHVRDMFHFHLGNWHFAIFNFADALICIGSALLILDMILQSRHSSKDGQSI